MRDRGDSPVSEFKYLVVEIAIAGIALASFAGSKYLGSKYLDKLSWWSKLSPFARRVLEGIYLLAFGAALLWNRYRRRGRLIAAAWEFKMVLFDVAMIVGGVMCLIEAIKLR